MFVRKCRFKPIRSLHGSRYTEPSNCQKGVDCLKEKLMNWLSFCKSPFHRLPGELSKLYSCQKIGEFRFGGWYSAENLVTAYAGQHNAIPLGKENSGELLCRLAERRTPLRERGESICCILRKEPPLGIGLEVTACLSPGVFNLCEIWLFVPVGFG